jgi:diguanylate cyclase (GGDEF)-like protein
MSLFIITSYQKPIREYRIMMDNISSANDLRIHAKELIDTNVYKALCNLNDSGIVSSLNRKLKKINDIKKDLIDNAVFNNEIESINILSKLVDSFISECKKTVEPDTRKTMRSRLENYKKTSEIYGFLNNSTQDYITIQIVNRKDMSLRLTESTNRLFIYYIIAEAVVFSVSILAGLLFTNRISLSIVNEIQKSENAEQKMRQMAHHDPLTGIPNRRFFIDKFSNLLESKCNFHNDQSFAVLFIDLDGFKTVNDTLGHDYGDEVLVITAQRLKNILRQHDTLARLGGDEFAILLENVNKRDEIKFICTRIISSVSETIVLKDKEIKISASVGIYNCSTLDKSESDGELLLSRADRAMYEAKRMGKNTFVFFDEIG